jgi:hypothetical protein
MGRYHLMSQTFFYGNGTTLRAELPQHWTLATTEKGKLVEGPCKLRSEFKP